MLIMPPPFRTSSLAICDPYRVEAVAGGVDNRLWFCCSSTGRSRRGAFCGSDCRPRRLMRSIQPIPCSSRCTVCDQIYVDTVCFDILALCHVLCGWDCRPCLLMRSLQPEPYSSRFVWGITPHV